MLAEYGDDEDNLPLIDLVSQQLRLRLQLEERLFNVLKQGQYILGPEVKILESQLSAYVGVKHCITVASGTDALLIALLAIGIKPGDEVITTPFNSSAPAEVIALLGAKPVFVDIEPQTYTLNPDLLEAAITPKTKAVIPVNLYGQCADFDTINQIAKKHHIAVIEDAAHSFGATYNEHSSCALSTIGCTSFLPTRTLGAYGDAGACFTNDDTLAETMQQLRNHGQSKHNYHRLIGTNSHLDTLQASLLLAKFMIFPQELEERTRIATLYTRLLEGKVKTPVILPRNTSVYAQYTIEVTDRDCLREKLLAHSIETAVYYPLPLHLQPAFSYLGYSTGSFPIAETAAQHVLSLPMHPYLTREMQHHIVQTITN
ncbi:MAG: aminotransferase DegT [Beggiatoa sp. IS2]|nr:MAG: aminotransferase DegT [Beggiatoa sp. IS2]